VWQLLTVDSSGMTVSWAALAASDADVCVPSARVLCCPQALFRKIAAALPGMENAVANKQEELVNVQLTPATVSLSAPTPAAASTCSC
jgi:hypothetical protein